MVEVICDTSFLIHLATRRIKNISNIETEIGQIQFVVPQVVKAEIDKLSEDPSKKKEATFTLEFIKKLKTVPISGDFADKVIISYVKKNRGIVATMDRQLKIQVKQSGGSVISFSGDKIILES